MSMKINKKMMRSILNNLWMWILRNIAIQWSFYQLILENMCRKPIIDKIINETIEKHVNSMRMLMKINK